MATTDEVININADDDADRPVIINCQSGSTVTVNVNIRNYYGLPQWMDRDALDAILKTIQQGRG